MRLTWGQRRTQGLWERKLKRKEWTELQTEGVQEPTLTQEEDKPRAPLQTGGSPSAAPLQTAPRKCHRIPCWVATPSPPPPPPSLASRRVRLSFPAALDSPLRHPPCPSCTSIPHLRPSAHSPPGALRAWLPWEPLGQEICTHTHPTLSPVSSIVLVTRNALIKHFPTTAANHTLQGAWFSSRHLTPVQRDAATLWTVNTRGDPEGVK